ncbi:MAG: UDP-2,3-diacylglucosamine diphosphatase [Gammaproteobacteria bacterium]|nr:UDP-2,3-diacylglucosamine diphosphatase [Gammaproteobacteria bacterium]
MGQVLFISDLHLDEARPEVTNLFLEFLATEARSAHALYILGDLFEAWIGDDDPNPHHARVQDALAALTASGVPTYFMHGNRDFLVGQAFAERTGVHLLEDPTVIDLYEEPTVLLHGDTLCTDDVEYQQFRQMVRNPDWQREFLSQPVAARQAFADKARAESRSAQSGKAMAIMDVNQDTVAAAFADCGVRRMIHGHTHRPAIHTQSIGGQTCQRIVLGDWYTQGSVLRATAAGLSLSNLPL